MIELDRLFCRIGKGRELRLYDKRSQYSEDKESSGADQYGCIDMSFFGLKRLYFVTDHDSFYERYDWTYLCMVNDLSCGESIRMYEKMIDRH